MWFVGDSSTNLWSVDRLKVSILNADPIGASLTAVVVAEDEAVWVAGDSATSLWRLDPKTDEAEGIPVGATSGGIVAGFGRIWTSPGSATP